MSSHHARQTALFKLNMRARRRTNKRLCPIPYSSVRIAPCSSGAGLGNIVPGVFTPVLAKHSKPIQQFKATAKLGEFLETRFSHSF